MHKLLVSTARMKMVRLPATDLIRVAELIKLGAETVRAFSDFDADKADRIFSAAGRIEGAAQELIDAALEMRVDPTTTNKRDCGDQM